MWNRRLLLVVALLLLAGLSMGQDSGCDTSTEEPEVEGGKKGKGGKGKVASVGEKLRLKGTQYQVTSVKTASTVGDPSIGGERANGVFIIAKLRLTNLKNEPATIDSENLPLIGGNGKRYTTSDDAAFAVGGGDIFLEEIQPDNTERGTLIYDVPKRALSGAKIQVEDLFSDSKGQIRLGL